MGSKRLRAAWEVNAGIIPLQPMEEYRTQFFYTEEEAEKDRSVPPGEMNTFTRLMIAAHDRAKEITQPSLVNWVQVTFIWY